MGAALNNADWIKRNPFGLNFPEIGKPMIKICQSGNKKKKFLFVLLIKISSLDFCKYLKIKESQSFVFTVCFFPGKTWNQRTSPYGPKKSKVVLLGLLGVIFIITRQLHQVKNSSHLIKE